MASKEIVYVENNWKSQCKRFWLELLAFRSTFFIIFTPLLLLPLPLVLKTQPAYCGYVLLLMAVWWITEALPISVTSLVPLFALPMFGIMTAGQTSMNYMKNANVLFLGGIMVAIAIERWNLHKRIAFRILMVSGSKPVWLMLGFMLVTWFLSMWISNTATTAMMIPVIQAVLDQLDPKPSMMRLPSDTDDIIEDEEKSLLRKEQEKMSFPTRTNSQELTEFSHPPKHMMREDSMAPSEISDTESDPNGYKNGASHKTQTSKKDLTVSTRINIEDETAEHMNVLTKRKQQEEKEKADFINISKGMNICVCFAANIGGVATLTGTAPNLVLQGFAQRLYAQHGLDSPISFTGWMAFGLPFAAVAIVVCWFWLQFFFFGLKGSVFGLCRKSDDKDIKNEKAVKDVLKHEYEKLGPMTFAEKIVLVLFVVLAILWLTRDPRFVPGWGILFKPRYVTDSTVAILVSFLLFIVPSRRPTFFCCRGKGDNSPSGPVEPILDWETVWHKFPWGVLILVGGGFALAEGAEISGLSAWVSSLLVALKYLPPWLMVMIIAFAVSLLTQVTSNTAITTLMLPILASLAESIGVHPLYIMIPATVSASCAFMLPVATPPNAIVYAYGKITVMDLIKSGAIMNILCVLIVTLGINSWGVPVYSLNVHPWLKNNSTLGVTLDYNNDTTVFLNPVTAGSHLVTQYY